MTWITTWPGPNAVPQYAAHDTESKADAHATEIVTSGRALVATVFWLSDSEEPA